MAISEENNVGPITIDDLILDLELTKLKRKQQVWAIWGLSSLILHGILGIMMIVASVVMRKDYEKIKRVGGTLCRK